MTDQPKPLREKKWADFTHTSTQTVAIMARGTIADFIRPSLEAIIKSPNTEMSKEFLADPGVYNMKVKLVFELEEKE